MPRTKGSQNKNKKEKPIKKKKRGRPPKQYQHQHQIVNVNVGGGGGGGGGPKTIPVPFQLPSTIYDPSLIQPHYGINDRQPVNPLTDAASDLMTPLIQSIISNQAQNVPPIKEAVKPLNPNVKGPMAQPIAMPQQSDQSNPIPQKNQPPIPPEIIIDSNIQLPIHNKHLQHKNLQNQIKPQTPIITKPKKIKDNEGLGKKIPLERIGQIAGSIATGALTGGATLVGEAVATGSLGAVTAEGIASSLIGGGVASGVSDAVGNLGAVGNVISGVAGGVAGRVAARNTAWLFAGPPGGLVCR